MICIHCGHTIPDGEERCPLCKEATECEPRSFYQPCAAPIPCREEPLPEQPLAEEIPAADGETEPDLEELLSARIRQLRDYVTNLWKRGTENDGR